MQERRRQDRRSLIHHLHVKHEESGETLGFLANISEGGIMLLSQKPVNGKGAPGMPIDVMLPGEFFTRSHFCINAHTVWNVQDQTSGLYATGMEFENTTEDTCRLVDEIILALGSRED